MGEYAQRYKKETGLTEVCIQTGGRTTPNLNERLKGVRFALSGGMQTRRLEGENGWIEYERCPFYNLGKTGQALIQLKYILKQEKPPVFIAVAGFAQFSPNYIREVMPYREQIQTGQQVVISADAEEAQLEALKLGLSSVNIGQRPFEMGRYGAQLVYDIVKHQKMPQKEINYLGFYYCKIGQPNLCSLARQ